MARVSRCDKLPEQERLRLIGRIGDGASWPQLAAEFGLPQSTIAEWATRNGHGRNPSSAKRKADELEALNRTYEGVYGSV